MQTICYIMQPVTVNLVTKHVRLEGGIKATSVVQPASLFAGLGSEEPSLQPSLSPWGGRTVARVCFTSIGPASLRESLFSCLFVFEPPPLLGNGSSVCPSYCLGTSCLSSRVDVDLEAIESGGRPGA